MANAWAISSMTAGGNWATQVWNAGAPHGLTETHKEQLNADLPAFFKA